MDRALAGRPVDVEQFLDADFNFHLTMAKSTGNPLVR